MHQDDNINIYIYIHEASSLETIVSLNQHLDQIGSIWILWIKKHLGLLINSGGFFRSRRFASSSDSLDVDVSGCILTTETLTPAAWLPVYLMGWWYDSQGFLLMISSWLKHPNWNHIELSWIICPGVNIEKYFQSETTTVLCIYTYIYVYIVNIGKLYSSCYLGVFVVAYFEAFST